MLADELKLEPVNRLFLNSGYVTGHMLLNKPFQGGPIESIYSDDSWGGGSSRHNTFPLIEYKDGVSLDSVLELSALHGAFLSPMTVPDDRLMDIAARLSSTVYKTGFLRGLPQSVLISKQFPNRIFPNSIRCDIKHDKMLRPNSRYNVYRSVPQVADFREANIARDIAIKYMGGSTDYLNNLTTNSSEVRQILGTYERLSGEDTRYIKLNDSSKAGIWVTIYTFMNEYIRDNYTKVMKGLKVFESERLYCLFSFPALDTEADVVQFRNEMIYARGRRAHIQFNLLIPRVIKKMKKSLNEQEVIEFFTVSDVTLYSVCSKYFKPKDAEGGSVKDAAWYRKVGGEFVGRYCRHLYENRMTFSAMDVPVMRYSSSQGIVLKEYSTINDIIIDDIIVDEGLQKCIDKYLPDYEVIIEDGRVLSSFSKCEGVDDLLRDIVSANPNSHILQENFNLSVQSTFLLCNLLERTPSEGSSSGPSGRATGNNSPIVIYVDCDNCSPLQYIRFLTCLQGIYERWHSELRLEEVCIKYIVNRGFNRFWDLIVDSKFMYFEHMIIEVERDTLSFKSASDLVLSMVLYRDAIEKRVKRPIILSNDSDFMASVHHVVNNVGTMDYEDFCVLCGNSRVKSYFRQSLLDLKIPVVFVDSLVTEVEDIQCFYFLVHLYVLDKLKKTGGARLGINFLYNELVMSIFDGYHIAFNVKTIANVYSDVLSGMGVAEGAYSVDGSIIKPQITGPICIKDIVL